eukprot:GFUD01054010.1.p1 GENE.GFUD01054010.1~~GFUD01054010.1.p1  ORF type:complete len:112 (-),score=23.57 GFUD01054010.1:49-384(-)
MLAALMVITDRPIVATVTVTDWLALSSLVSVSVEQREVVIIANFLSWQNVSQRDGCPPCTSNYRDQSAVFFFFTGTSSYPAMSSFILTTLVLKRKVLTMPAKAKRSIQTNS